MKWYIAVSQQTNCDGKKPGRLTRARGWYFGTVLIILAFTILACTFFGSTPQPTVRRIVILTHLPMLTPTPLLISPGSDALEMSFPVLAETSIPTPLPTPTIVPVIENNAAGADPLPTKDSEPSLLTSLVVLNVRSGPGAVYEIIGKLAAGQSTTVLGRNPEGNWWQIVYPPKSANTGWVSADAQFSTVSHPDEVLVAQAPVPPTATATAVATETPPATPTGAPMDQTQTPEPTGISTLPPRAIPTVSESGGWLR